MAEATFVCGSHQVFIYERGGVTPVGELTPVEMVKWNRMRDDISTAEAVIPSHSCCELLGDLRSVLHELHMVRDGVTVWQGPITRIVYEYDKVRIFAEDILWQAKRTVLTVGYDQAGPNVSNVISRMNWLLGERCYDLYGNPWNARLNPIHHVGDPTTFKSVNAYQYYVWEDFDKYAEDNGADYTVINRDIFYFDNHLAWHVLPPLDEVHMSQFPTVVEYGNQLATRAFYTNSEGYAGQAAVNPGGYGVVDLLTNNIEEGTEQQVPTPEEIAQWDKSAAHSLVGKAPAPVSVSIPANTTLMPDAPWTIDDLIPGGWFEVNVTMLCRPITQWQRLHEVVVEESAPGGEKVSFTAVDAPKQMVMP